MKLRELLGKIRLRPLQGTGERSIDDVDGLATMHYGGTNEGNIPTTVPPGYVPSQQDDRPRH